MYSKSQVLGETTCRLNTGCGGPGGGGGVEEKPEERTGYAWSRGGPGNEEDKLYEETRRGNKEKREGSERGGEGIAWSKDR